MADRREGWALGWTIGVMLVTSLTASSIAISKKPKDNRNAFIRGYDYGRTFLNPSGFKGANYRRGLQHMHELYGPWCWQYMKYNYVGCLSRIWLESRGNPWSHTKDTMLEEAGLTSVSWNTASRLSEIDQGGDPCGDPRWAIAANAWRSREQRVNMLEGVKDPEAPVPEPKWWASWLPRQCNDNRIECEYFMGVCGGVNCWKVQKALMIADKAVQNKHEKPHLPEGILANEHTWWKLMVWLRDKTDSFVMDLFAPLKLGLWQFGSRWGRIPDQWDTRAEFFPPLPDGQPNYCWGDDLYWYPQIPVPSPDGTVAMTDIFPQALYPMPKHKDWRKRCVLYGKRAWYKIWHEPKSLDRYKKGKRRGQRMYLTEEAFEQGHADWIDEMQAQGLLPTDEEYAIWEQSMKDEGCEFIPAVTDDEWEAFKAKKSKKKGVK